MTSGEVITNRLLLFFNLLVSKRPLYEQDQVLRAARYVAKSVWTTGLHRCDSRTIYLLLLL